LHCVPGLEPRSSVAIEPACCGPSPGGASPGELCSSSRQHGAAEIRGGRKRADYYRTGRKIYESNIYIWAEPRVNVSAICLHSGLSGLVYRRGYKQATSRLHLPEACADGDALGVDECGQLGLGLHVRDARLREAFAAAHRADLPHLVRVGVRVRVRVTAAHRADLPHLKRFRARIRVRVRVSVGTAGHAGQVTLTLAQT